MGVNNNPAYLLGLNQNIMIGKELLNLYMTTSGNPQVRPDLVLCCEGCSSTYNQQFGIVTLAKLQFGIVHLQSYASKDTYMRYHEALGNALWLFRYSVFSTWPGSSKP